MANYRFLATDALTRTVREEIPFESVRFASALNGAGAFSASLNAHHPKAIRATLDPARTIIYIERDGSLVGGWWLWSAKTNGDQVQFDGAELWSYWRHRYLRSTQTFTNADPVRIAVWLLSVAAGETGSWQGTDLAYEATNTKLTVTYDGKERKNVGQLIDDLSKSGVNYGGFDFGYETYWAAGEIKDKLRIWQRRGRVLDLTFEENATAETVDLTVDGSACANRVELTGSGQNDEMQIATLQDANLFKIYPLLEYVESNSDTNDVFYLAYRAASRLAAKKTPPEMVEVTAGKHSSVAFGQYAVGDTVQVRATSNYTSCDVAARIVGIDVSIGADGAEVVKLTFASEDQIG